MLKEVITHEVKTKRLEEDHSITLENMEREFQQRLDEKEKEIEFLGNEMMTKSDELIDAQVSYYIMNWSYQDSHKVNKRKLRSFNSRVEGNLVLVFHLNIELTLEKFWKFSVESR